MVLQWNNKMSLFLCHTKTVQYLPLLPARWRGDLDLRSLERERLLGERERERLRPALRREYKYLKKNMNITINNPHA